MINYTVYNKTTGRILRSGLCQLKDLENQAELGEEAIQGKADDYSQKVVQVAGVPTVQDKTQVEIDAEKPPPIDPLDQQASMTRRELNALLARITALENKP